MEAYHKNMTNDENDKGEWGLHHEVTPRRSLNDGRTAWLHNPLIQR
jgi:hypothetical protein